MSRAKLVSEQSERFEEPDLIDGVSDAAPYVVDSSPAPSELRSFFDAAHALWTARPWAMTDDEPFLHVEVPALGIDDGCLSILGGLGGVRGFAFYPSARDYEQMIESAAAAWPCAPFASYCALFFSFEAASKVPLEIQKQIRAQSLPIPDEASYPNLQPVIYGLAAPVMELELRLGTAIMRALVTLTQQHSQAVDACEHIRHSYSDEGGLEVILTYPHPFHEYGRESLPRAPTLSSSNPYQLPFEARELAKLEHALGSFTLHRVVGMFCAVCSVPIPPSPVVWLGELVRNLPPGSGPRRRYALDQLEAVYLHVVRTLREHAIYRLVPEADDVNACREWSRGYAALLARVDPSEFKVDILDAAFPMQALAEIPEALTWLEEFRGEESQAEAMLRYRESLAGDACYLFQAWDHARVRHEAKTVERAAAKLGRNDRCRCGSGKKFKRCCAS